MLSQDTKLHVITAVFGGGLSILSLLVMGCGSDTGSDDSSAIESGVAPDKLLSELTLGEARTLCEATTAALLDNYSTSRQLTAACTIEASVLAVSAGPDGQLHLDQKTCERVRDECVARIVLPPNAVPSNNCSDLVMPGGAAATCAATVDDFERCAGASLHQAAVELSQWDCAYLAKQPVMRGGSAMTVTESAPVAECGDYEAKCGSFALLDSSTDN
ncbi:MAG TPA: hypothetical protein VFG30_03795 [Polyangiales bacterium]|nr:hypothetical protein [Polyangiales bacterium]